MILDLLAVIAVCVVVIARRGRKPKPLSPDARRMANAMRVNEAQQQYGHWQQRSDAILREIEAERQKKP